MPFHPGYREPVKVLVLEALKQVYYGPNGPNWCLPVDQVRSHVHTLLRTTDLELDPRPINDNMVEVILRELIASGWVCSFWKTTSWTTGRFLTKKKHSNTYKIYRLTDEGAQASL